ncbi:MAG: hypothetical protein GC168_09320 [Candidatus Hydrogenedens sp.]|nr:hypothetical protein [Candidatus Hydrogenedens sp.]
MEFDPRRSLLELDPAAWGEDADWDLGPAAMRLAQKPVRRLEAGELLYFVRRNASLPITVPLALDKLEGAPFLQGESHPGDLLVALLEADATFWALNEPLWMRAMLVLSEAAQEIEAAREREELEDYLPNFVGEDFMAAVLHFKDIHQHQPADEPDTEH